MLVSTEIFSYKKWGCNEEILKLLKNSGFDAYDFSMFVDAPENYIFCQDYLDKAKKLRAFADSIGIVCNQAHAPFPMSAPRSVGWRKYLYEKLGQELNLDFFNMDDAEQRFALEIENLVKKSIEIAGILGAKNIVVHPNNDFNAEQNFELYSKFYEIAKASNVCIAVENMFNRLAVNVEASVAACSHHTDFVKHLSLLDENVFVACLDVGHAEMQGLNTSAVEMIKALGARLKCLHIHDNDKFGDLHNLPYTGKINFEEIIKTLIEIGYDGDITLEADTYINRFDKEFIQTATKYVFEIANYIRRQVLGKNK